MTMEHLPLLHVLECDPVVMRYWRLARSEWRQGFATEGGFALLRHAFDTVGSVSVCTDTMAVNKASRGVMRKLGMRHIRTYHPHWDEPLPGAEYIEVVYAITRDAWLGESPTPPEWPAPPQHQNSYRGSG